MNRLTLIVLLVTLLPLYGLEIRLNGNLYSNYDRESLEDLSYILPYEGEKGIFLEEILPLMEDIRRFTFYNEDYILETDPASDLRIVLDEDELILKGESLGSLILPRTLEIEGSELIKKELIVWFDKTDKHLEREISIFAKLHHMEPIFRISDRLVSLLEYNNFNNRTIPDLIVFGEDKINKLGPLIPMENTEQPRPYKLYRTIFLSNSTYGKNNKIAADFGDLDIFYPLNRQLEDGISMEKTLAYIKKIASEGYYSVSTNPVENYISGESDKIYGLSPLLALLPEEPLIPERAGFPLMEGNNPAPLVLSTYLVRPQKSSSEAISRALIQYLTGFGVQQRIDPETGYLPVDQSVYPLLKNSHAKTILLQDLEKAVYLPPNDQSDKLRFVLPKIIPLIVNGRLTVEEGIFEIQNYLSK